LFETDFDGLEWFKQNEILAKGQRQFAFHYSHRTTKELETLLITKQKSHGEWAKHIVGEQ
jgi:hypothetical protein